MKLPVIGLLMKVVELFSKKLKNGEKAQEIETLKLSIFKEALVNVLYVFVTLIVINVVFPKFQIGDWIYNITDRILTYMMGQIGG